MPNADENLKYFFRKAWEEFHEEIMDQMEQSNAQEQIWLALDKKILQDAFNAALTGFFNRLIRQHIIDQMSGNKNA